ncbi:MAG TPA: ribose 5-phosphate isomerase B [Thermoanaerobaculia bacterium]|nr:ribose 5-phosphate isomerase B [Thermoanaerobaculia bacterium]HUM29733.1 ribose 5-phosphate isomerase B [Thermoanaerobaculia bacterium]HXK67033.1 ribose 5-phosphate isomerase B [Thermoanaerobaculia bacterium]
MAESIALAADHAGASLKDYLADLLRNKGYSVKDLGTDGAESVDYPDYASALAEGISRGRWNRGILVCGTGIGMSIRANRYPGVRAANCNDLYMVRLARQHNDANVLTLGARIVAAALAEEITELFLSTEFSGGRHARRVEKLDAPCPS